MAAPRTIIANSLLVDGLQFSAISADASGHPNKMRVRGVLVRLDEPSTKAPNGSEGHRIYVPADVAKRRLRSLVGMGLNYSPELTGHAQRRKVGVIDKAWIDGKNLCIEGTVWVHDFPEASRDLKQPGLGMSMEIGSVHVEDVNADVWRLNDFYFLGATILWKDAAAYYRTQAIAASATERRNAMIKKTAKKATVLNPTQIAEIAAGTASEAVAKHIAGTLKQQTDILSDLAGRVTTLEINSSAVVSCKDDEEEDEDAGADMVPEMKTKVKAAKDDEEDDEEAMAARHAEPDGDEEDDDDEDDDLDSAGDTGDLNKVGPKTADPGDDTPGKFNEKAKNKGNKTSSENDLGKNVAESVTGSALKVITKQLKQVTAQLATVLGENRDMKRQLSRYQKQAITAGSNLERRSLSAELSGLLKKNNLDPVEMLAAGQKMAASDVDAIINASLPNMNPTDRIAIKNGFRNAGLLDDGRVDRSIR